ncbi:hypothetical protein [Streptomyces sp. NPDC046727]|uniref:hypothetical protein n=1 Tax=Streptomyces sp. NPDC046727 TaxID=3155373 RepID=UPI0033CEF197
MSSTPDPNALGGGRRPSSRSSWPGSSYSTCHSAMDASRSAVFVPPPDRAYPGIEAPPWTNFAPWAGPQRHPRISQSVRILRICVRTAAKVAEHYGRPAGVRSS